MDRKERETELHAILLKPGGREKLIALLDKYQAAGDAIDHDMHGTPLVDAILDRECPPERPKAAGDEKFEEPPAAEAPGG